jgi:hypothetical protein
MKILTAQNMTLKTEVDKFSVQINTIQNECTLIREENRLLKDDLVASLTLISSLEKVVNKIDSKVDQNYFPPLTQTQFSFSKPIENVFKPPNPISLTTTTTQNTPSTPRGTKRPQTQQNNASNKALKTSNATPAINAGAIKPTNTPSNNNQQRQNRPKQAQLKTFDSSNPDSANVDIIQESSSNDDRPFTTVEPRKRRRTFAKSIGTDLNDLLAINQRQSYIFISRISSETTEEQVNAYLTKTLVSRGIKYANLTESTLKHTQWKAFTFSVDFLNRNIYKDKTIWSAGMYVDIHKKPRIKSVETISNSNGMEITASTSNNNNKNA